MAELETKNAVIKRAALEIEDHGILTVVLHLDYDGAGQGFGQYSLDTHQGKYWADPKPSYCAHFIRRCLEIAGVHKWSDLPGKTIRVQAEWTKCHAIGHIVKDDWFWPGKEFEEAQASADHLLRGDDGKQG